MKLSPGIATYEDRVVQILQVMPDWIDQNVVDEKLRSLPFLALYHAPESYILHWSGPDLHLLLLMVKEKLVERKTKRGLIYYRAARG